MISAKPGAARRGMNRRLVELWRSRRPAGGWDIEDKGSVPQYIALTAVHHVKNAWEADWEKDEVAISWLSDFVDGKQDAIPVFASQSLGLERAMQLAEAAECRGEWFLAALRWSACALSEHSLGSYGRSLPLLQRSAKALERVDSHKAKAQLESTVLFRALQSFDSEIDACGYTARLQTVIQAEPDVADIVTLLAVALFTEMWPAMQSADLLSLGRTSVKMARMAGEARRKVHTSDKVQLCYLMMYPCMTAAWQSLGVFDLPDFEWDALFGERGSSMSQIMSYNYEQMHVKMRLGTGFDALLAYPGWAIAPLAHYGDLCAANTYCSHMLPSVMRNMEEWAPVDVHVLMYTKSIWPFWLYVMGRKDDARAMLAAGPYDGLPEQFDWIGKVRRHHCQKAHVLRKTVLFFDLMV